MDKEQVTRFAHDLRMGTYERVNSLQNARHVGDVAAKNCRMRHRGTGEEGLADRDEEATDRRRRRDVVGMHAFARVEERHIR